MTFILDKNDLRENIRKPSSEVEMCNFYWDFGQGRETVLGMTSDGEAPVLGDLVRLDYPFTAITPRSTLIRLVLPIKVPFIIQNTQFEHNSYLIGMFAEHPQNNNNNNNKS